MEILNKFILVGRWTALGSNYSLNSSRYEFIQRLKVSGEILVHYSAQTVSSSFCDDAGRYRHLTFFSKMRHKFSIILRSGDCGGQIKYSASQECSSCH